MQNKLETPIEKGASEAFSPTTSDFDDGQYSDGLWLGLRNSDRPCLSCCATLVHDRIVLSQKRLVTQKPYINKIVFIRNTVLQKNEFS